MWFPKKTLLILVVQVPIFLGTCDIFLKILVLYTLDNVFSISLFESQVFKSLDLYTLGNVCTSNKLLRTCDVSRLHSAFKTQVIPLKGTIIGEIYI